MDFCSVITYFLIFSSIIRLVSYLIVFVVFSVQLSWSVTLCFAQWLFCVVVTVRRLISIREATRLHICHVLERWYDDFRVKGVICSQACRTP